MKIKYALIVLIITASIMASAQTKSAMLETQSRFSFDQTVEKLTAVITENGWKVTYTHDLQETMKKNGKEVLPVKIIELCNPNFAYQILSRDDVRESSNLLPCRIAVYEKADGKTYLSRMNAVEFAPMIGEAGKTVIEAFTNAEKFVNSVAVEKPATITN